MISRAGVLLVAILGSVPVSAISVASGGNYAPALAAQASPPTGLTATAVSSSEVDLSWTAPQTTTTPVSPSPTSPSPVSPPPTSPSPVNPPPTSPSPSPSQTSPSPSPSSTSPSPPVGIGGRAIVHTGVLLAGKYVPGATAEGYDVYDGTRSAGESGPVDAQPVTGTTFKVTGLAPGTTYFFDVTAVYPGSGQSGPSNEARATTLSAVRSSGPGGPPGSSAMLLLAGGLAVIGAATAGVLFWRRRRLPMPVDPSSVPPVIRAVPDAGPLPAISVHATGTGATHTVRVESHQDPGITTIEEVPPP